ncbi:MAG TPA: hypothetical protein VLH61_02975 [Bacteroidales bacterium]|nr:hypothetical protein [Bacteroidales bacterium]
MKTGNAKHMRLKLAFIILALIIIAIFIGQNWQPLTVTLLGIKIEGKAFFVFICLFAAGFALGYLLCKYRKKSKIGNNTAVEPRKVN